MGCCASKEEEAESSRKKSVEMKGKKKGRKSSSDAADGTAKKEKKKSKAETALNDTDAPPAGEKKKKKKKAPPLSEMPTENPMVKDELADIAIVDESMNEPPPARKSESKSKTPKTRDRKGSTDKGFSAEGKLSSQPSMKIDAAAEILPGKEGWLFRENEDKNAKAADQFLKIWVTLYENRLTYYSTAPPELERPASARQSKRTTGWGSSAVTAAPVSTEATAPRVAKGFVNCSDKSEVKIRFLEKVKGKMCFTVSDAAIHITFAGCSEKEREEWVTQIKTAIGGVRHVPTSNGSGTAIEKAIAIVPTTALEMPRKTGPLKKHAIGGTLGVKSVKVRWFRLDGGELRYYGEESMRPSQLKGTIKLNNATLKPSDGKNDKSIDLKLADGTTLSLEASTGKLASEWKDSFSITLSNLQVMSKSSSGGGTGKKRRANLMNERDSTTTAPSEVEARDSERSSIFVKKNEMSTEVIQKALKSHFLLSSLKDFGPLMNALQLEVSLPGDVVIWQDTKGDLFYILESGEAVVEKDGNVVGHIQSGKAFGELALLNNIARSATIRASMVCRLWTLDRSTFRAVLATQERQIRDDKIRFLKGVRLFDQLSAEGLIKLADVMTVTTSFSKGEKIIKQGDAGDRFYMIHKGTVAVSQYASTFSSSKHITNISVGGYFGDLALMSNEPRKATVTATEETLCWTLDRTMFNSILGSVREALDESIGMSILKNVKLLSSLTQKQMLVISRCLQKKEYADNEEIIKQGETGDHFYMIATGDVKVQINHVEVARLSAGSFFGEMALMKNDTRNATVLGAGKTTCLLLTRDDFVRLLGPLDDLIQAEASRRELAAKTAKKGGSSFSFFSKSNAPEPITIASSDTVRARLAPGEALLNSYGKQFKLDQFATIQILSNGNFSAVKLVQHTGTSKTFALKMFSKQKLLDLKQEGAPFSEKEMMLMFDHPFIPALYATFKDDNCLYFLMELLPGGDFWSVLYNGDVELGSSSCGGISLQNSQFYVSHVMSLLLYIHEQDIAYRDLKPENIMIDASGFVKLVDMGNAKLLPPPLTSNTMCGSPEYISPEMVLSKEHSHGVDFWALGIFLFETLTRTTPFEHDNAAIIYQNIIDSEEVLKMCFKTEFPPDAKDLICKLLLPNPNVRIGMLRNGPADLWSHPFFSKPGITEENIGRRGSTAPYVPTLNRATDVVNFAEFDDVDVDMPDYTGNYNFSTF